MAQAPTSKIKTEPVSSETLTRVGYYYSVSWITSFCKSNICYLSANDVGGYLPVLTSSFNLFQKPEDQQQHLKILSC
jgi:hypothetical protein